MWTYKRRTPRATFAILAVAVTIMLGMFIDILATHTPVQSVPRRRNSAPGARKLR